jgi:hypothetical protein
VSSSPLDAIYSSTATASLPFAAGEAIAGPNYLGVYAGAGAISDGFSGSSDDGQSIAYATDHLLLSASAPQSGYLGFAVSIIGFSDLEVTGTGPGSSQTNILYRITTVDPSTNVVSGTACVTTFANGCASGIPGLVLLDVPYIEGSDDTVIIGQELYAGAECDLPVTAAGTCSAQAWWHRLQSAAICKSRT